MAVVISNNTDRFQDTVDDYISNIKPFEYAVLAFVPICFLIMVGCMIKLYSLFRWNRYKAHTVVLLDKNDTRLRTTLLAWAVLTGLLKLDFFFLFSYAVQLVPSQLMEYTIPSYESIIVFFFGLAAFLLAIQATRTENTRLMWLLSLVILGSIGYFGYRLFTFGFPRDSTNDPYMPAIYDINFDSTDDDDPIYMSGLYQERIISQDPHQRYISLHLPGLLCYCVYYKRSPPTRTTRWADNKTRRI
ncbi:hypothetical protein [Parasitella parasitica]|uniref:Uncharacterized protein n=1 Tax=Parasitella parasitica TaxID=35722 RepID=A0A0B7N484_9FUNG|nr:hypothetical protein [Parasitella parasitica]